MFTKFIIFLFSSLGVIGLASYAIYRAFTHLNVLNGSPAKILLWLLIIMPLLFIATTILGMKMYSPVIGPIYTVAAVWLPILMYFFISAIILTILNTLFPTFALNQVYKVLVYSFITISILLPIYGIFNAQNITVTNITVPKDNRLANNLSGKKVILMSDTHIGIINGKKFLEKVVKKVEDQNPDIILFAGDLIDGPKFKMEQSLSPLQNLKATDGAYYTPGNHEVYSGEEKRLYEITDQYTTGLRNSKKTVLGIDIIGLTYDAYEGKDALINRLNKSGFDANTPSIVIHHDPKNNLVLQNQGVDLVVSGHTHGGQFWPFTAIVKRIFKDYYHGIKTTGNSSSITTFGAGTWGPPVRIGTNAEIISITFE